MKATIVITGDEDGELTAKVEFEPGLNDSNLKHPVCVAVGRLVNFLQRTSDNHEEN